MVVSNHRYFCPSANQYIQYSDAPHTIECIGLDTLPGWRTSGYPTSRELQHGRHLSHELKKYFNTSAGMSVCPKSDLLVICDLMTVNYRRCILQKSTKLQPSGNLFSILWQNMWVCSRFDKSFEVTWEQCQQKREGSIVTPRPSRPGSNGNKEVFLTSQISRNGASLTDPV